MMMKDIPPEQSLIEYPSRFPIKVMGQNVDGFAEAVVRIAQEFDPGFDPASIETRPSRGNNYLGVTITITAVSRDQLDELYRTLSTHPLVKVVL
jgi:putative lipoic acid-binding regulatory protein